MVHCVYVFLQCLYVSRGLLTSVASQQGGAIARAERGEVTLSEVSKKNTLSLMSGGNAPGVTCVLCVDDATIGGRVCEGGPDQGCDAAS